jgi:hypothetical protein
MAELKTQAELQEEFLTEFTSQTDEINDENEGSTLDIVSGVTSVAVREIVARVVTDFRKTFFSMAHGPEITGGPDDLQTLAVDHFGDQFARPQAAKATGVVTFSRPTTGAGNVTIPVGTVVKTENNANGVSQRFVTLAEVTMTGLSINASVEAAIAGTEGNVLAATVDVIESTLTDASIVVTNDEAFAGGAAIQNDAEYREFIRNQIETLKGATVAAIEAKALTVVGVETATLIEKEMPVKEWDIGGGAPVGDFFRIAFPSLYIADANGGASPALIAAVEVAIASVRACGVRIVVLGAVGVTINWTGVITLDPGGPNYADLVDDPQPIIDSMTQYLADLAIGEDFNFIAANAHILSVWGPAGTGDLVSGGFSTTVPSGNVSIAENEKVIPGTVTI